MGNKQGNRELLDTVVESALAPVRLALALGDDDLVLKTVQFIVLATLETSFTKIDQLQKQLAEKEQELPY